MKREVMTFKVQRSKRRTDFLFNDGEFRPRSEKSTKTYRRKEKHRSSVEYKDFYNL